MMIRTRNVGGLDGTQARVLHDGIGMGLAVVELGGLVGRVCHLVGILVADLLAILLGDDLLVFHLVAVLVDLDGLLGRLLLLLFPGSCCCCEGCGSRRIGLGDDGGSIGSLGLLAGGVGVRAVLGLDGGSGSGTTRDLGRAGGTRNRGMVGVALAGISGSGSSSGGGKDLVGGLVASGDGLGVGGIAGVRGSSDAARLEGKRGGIHGDDSGNDD